MNIKDNDLLSIVTREVLVFLQLHCIGRKNAATAQKIAVSTGRNSREVRHAIFELRRNGEPIASSVNAPYGFFIPESEKEARECLNHLYSRIQEIYKTARSVEQGLKKRFPGHQMPLQLKDRKEPRKN
jgi:hypothetical protein